MKTLIILALLLSGCAGTGRLNPTYNTAPRYGFFGPQTASPNWHEAAEIYQNPFIINRRR